MVEWKRGKIPKLPKEVIEEAKRIEEGLGDSIIIVKIDGKVYRWHSLSEAEWIAAREKGLLSEWEELKVKGRVYDKRGSFLEWKGRLSVEGKALGVEGEVSPQTLVEDVLWRAYGIEPDDIGDMLMKLEGGTIKFEVELNISKEEVEGLRKFSLEYFIYKDARWKDENRRSRKPQ